jgi:hypothetical protein
LTYAHASYETWVQNNVIAGREMNFDIEFPDFPLASNVINDDTVNGTAGTFVTPNTSTVESGVQYGAAGTEYTGSYSSGLETKDITLEDNQVDLI